MTKYHNSATECVRSLLAAGLLLVSLSAGAAVIAPNDPPDLGNTPPDLSQSVDPNIVVTFDDSGSMTSNFMGDDRPFDLAGWGRTDPVNNPWFCAGVIDPRVTNKSDIRSESMNGVYYNPNVIYTPPLLQNGAPFADADSTLAAVWADGIAINRPALKITPASAAYNNNPNSAAGGNDSKVTIINGQLVNGTTSNTAAETCNNSGSPVCTTNSGTTCGPAQHSGGTISGCSCSGTNASHTCAWTDTYTTPTVTDKRWICGATSGSPTSGANPQYPTAFAGGEDVKLGGPYYYRYSAAAPTITVNAFGNPDAAGRANLYNKSNWEAVAITNTSVTINGKTVNQWQNFANWYAYYRTRNLMTRTALSRVFGVLGGNIRVAWQNINNGNFLMPSTAIVTNLLDSGNCTPSGVDPKTEQSNASTTCFRTAFFNWIFQVGASGSTPDRQATIRAGDFFKRNSNDLRDPYWDTGVSADLGCRQNFHMLVTDGFWNEGNPSTPGGFFDAHTARTLPDGTGYSISDTQSRIFWDVTKNPTGTCGSTGSTDCYPSLADIGFYYWATDLRSDLAPTTPIATPYHSLVPSYVKDATTGVTTSTGASAAAQKEEIYFNPANDPATWRHVVQFMVTLGVAGNLNFSNDVDCVGSNDLCSLRKGVTNSTGATGWPEASRNDPPAIDDTWHAAVNSRGSYFSASNPSNLVAHLTEIINSIVARSGQSSAESVSTSILNQGAVGFQGGYNSSGWTGNLIKQSLDPLTAAPVTTLWDAGCFLTGGLCAATNINVGAAVDPVAGRKIFTSIASGGTLVGKEFTWATLGTAEQNALSLDPATTHPDTTTTLVPVANGTADANGSLRLDYLRGDRTNETTLTATAQPTRFRPRQSVLGAIVNSQAVYEGAPSGNHLDIYPINSPEQTAAVGGSSYENFVRTYLTRKPTVYVGANDGMLHAFDAGTGAESWAYVPNALYANGQLDQLTNPVNNLTVSVDDTPIIQDVFTSGAWRTMLIGSLRLGGRGIFALDVTDSAAPLNDTAAKSKFLWEFTSVQDPDLGYTYGSANIARLRCNVSPCKGVGTPGGTWVVLVAGGYYPKTLPGQVNGNSAIDSAAGVTKTTTYLWVLNASDGSLIKKIPTKSGFISFGMSTPEVVDFGLDQLDDIAVAGDLAGNLWRFDLSDPNPATWTVDNIFKTYNNTTACSNVNTTGIGCEPISVMPVAFPDSVTGSVIYVFGSGQYLGNTDRTSASVLTPQHYFGVRDYGTGYANYPFTKDNLGTQTLTESGGIRSLTFTPTPPVTAPPRGWQIALNLTGAAGERDVTTVIPLFSTGTAILVSLIPGTNNDPCNPGRQGAVMAVSAETGGPPLASTSGSLTGQVGYRVINPPAVGGASAISILGGGTIILPGMGANGGPTPPQFQGLTPVWRRTSWNELLNNL